MIVVSKSLKWNGHHVKCLTATENINSLLTEFFWGNIKIYVQFVSFHHCKMEDRYPCILHGQISWLLMTWRHQGQGHQQPWYWPMEYNIVGSAAEGLNISGVVRKWCDDHLKIVSDYTASIPTRFDPINPVYVMSLLKWSELPTLSWWLLMSWRQIGAMPSATTMVTHLWLQWEMSGSMQLTHLATINSLGPSDAVWPHRTWSTTGSGNGLLPYSTKPLPGPMLTCQQWAYVVLSHEQF